MTTGDKSLHEEQDPQLTTDQKVFQDRGQLAELTYKVAENIIESAVILKDPPRKPGPAEVKKKLEDSIEVPLSLDDIRLRRGLEAAGILLQGGAINDRHFRYPQSIQESPNDVLGSLVDWDAKTFPFAAMIAEDPRFSLATLEIDQSGLIRTRDLPDPKTIKMFMAWSVAGKEVHREKQVIHRTNGEVEVRELTVTGDEDTEQPDFEPMDVSQLDDLNTDLNTLYNRIADYSAAETIRRHGRPSERDLAMIEHRTAEYDRVKTSQQGSQPTSTD